MELKKKVLSFCALALLVSGSDLRGSKEDLKMVGYSLVTGCVFFGGERLCKKLFCSSKKTEYQPPRIENPVISNLANFCFSEEEEEFEHSNRNVNLLATKMKNMFGGKKKNKKLEEKIEATEENWLQKKVAAQDEEIKQLKIRLQKMATAVNDHKKLTDIRFEKHSANAKTFHRRVERRKKEIKKLKEQVKNFDKKTKNSDDDDDDSEDSDSDSDDAEDENGTNTFIKKDNAVEKRPAFVSRIKARQDENEKKESDEEESDEEDGEEGDEVII